MRKAIQPAEEKPQRLNPGGPVRPADDPLCGDAPGRGVQAPRRLYTKTVEYEDINYSVASTEDQTAIFSGWSSFLNYFDSSLPFQLSFINRRSHSRSRYKVNIPQADDDFNSVREEFTGMLKIRSPGLTTGLNAPSTLLSASQPEGSWRPGPVWSVWRPM